MEGGGSMDFSVQCDSQIGLVFSYRVVSDPDVRGGGARGAGGKGGHPPPSSGKKKGFLQLDLDVNPPTNPPTFGQ